MLCRSETASVDDDQRVDDVADARSIVAGLRVVGGDAPEVRDQERTAEHEPEGGHLPEAIRPVHPGGVEASHRVDSSSPMANAERDQHRRCDHQGRAPAERRLRAGSSPMCSPPCARRMRLPANTSSSPNPMAAG